MLKFWTIFEQGFFKYCFRQTKKAVNLSVQSPGFFQIALTQKIMKKLFFFCLLSSFFSLSAQTLEEKAAEATCACLKSLPKVTEDAYTNCMGSSLANALAENPDKKQVKKKIKNVNRMLETLKAIQANLDQTCKVEIVKDPVIAKRDSVYKSYPSTESRELYLTGKKFMEKEKYREAIPFFEKAVSEAPNFVLAWDDMAKSYRNLEDYTNAVKYYEKSLEVFPQGEFALLNGAVAYVKMNNYSKGREFYSKLAEYYPKSGEGYFGLGRIYALQEDNENALHNFCRALKIYHSENSDYKKDAEMLIASIYQDMKKKGQEDRFIKIVQEYGINFK